MTPLRIRLQEWETLRPDSPEGRDLRGRQLTNDAARRAAVAETASERLIVRELAQGIELGSTSYVGRVTFGDLEVTIAPKLAPQVLLRLFRYAFGLRNLRLFEPSTFRTQDNLFVDLVVAQLHAEVAELVSRGLSRRYVEEATELMSPRGRLDVNQFARGGGRLDRGLPCIVFPRSENHLLNQVLVGGLRLGSVVASDLQIRSQCRRLATRLRESVEEPRLGGDTIASAWRSLDRRHAAYRPALRLVEMLVEGRALSLDDARAATTRVSGFLFDMNRFFQALLSRFLRENLAGYEVRDEFGISHMMRYAPEANPRNRRGPRPRPDFAIMRGGRLLSLLDAKYRDLWERSLPRDILYQLAIYGLSQGVGATASILHPVEAEGAREQRIEITDPVSGQGRAYVALHPVHLETLADLIGRGARSQARRRAFAREMVFGSAA